MTGAHAARTRLPDRRPNVSRRIDWRGYAIAVTVGHDPATGAAREVFASGPLFGSDLQAVIDDACVVISLALQHGACPRALARSLGTVPDPLAPDGDAPASVIGAIVATVIEEAAQPPIPGAAS